MVKDTGKAVGLPKENIYPFVLNKEAFWWPNLNFSGAKPILHYAFSLLCVGFLSQRK